jgi:hypothetical protein
VCVCVCVCVWCVCGVCECVLLDGQGGSVLHGFVCSPR